MISQIKVMIAVAAVELTVVLSAAGGDTGSLSLAGRWAFRLDPHREGIAREWFKTALPNQIQLPGTTDQAKLGIDNTAQPTLMGLYRPNAYAGPAWYQREIEVPAAWRDRRVTLFLERVHWETRVWLDGQPVSQPQDSLVTPHRHPLGTLTPGKHRLTLCVDNTIKFDLGAFVSIYSEHTQSNWNGIVGRIELLTHAAVRLADVQVYPDAGARKARVVVSVAGDAGETGRGVVSVEAAERGGKKVTAKEAEVSWGEKGGKVEIELPIGNDAKLWDEFHANLYELKVGLAAQSGPLDSRHLRFGLRDFGIRGKQFTLNGRPIYLRGDVECAIFPRTGYPAMDVDAWRRILRTVKSYGLNHLRFHSWTPPEAAFDAADEEGIMFQVEGPQANVWIGGLPQRDAFIAREIERILAVYGNHPSFCLLTMGNELTGKAAVLENLVASAVQTDPRHLYSSVSNGFGTSTSNSQFTVTMSVRGICGEGTAADFGKAIAKYPLPLVSHEVGQWQVFPDFQEMRKYNGVFEPRNFARVRDHLARNGLLDLAPRYVEATGKQAALLYKAEIEVLLRTPNHAGFQLLSLRDYPGTGTALVGILDPFWDSKGLITPEAFRRFCNSTVPLLRLPKRTWSVDEPFTAGAELAHFGASDMTAATPVWNIEDQHGRELASGSLPVTTVKTGSQTKLGRIETSLANAKAPCKLTVTLMLKGTAFVNDWEIWVYPPSKEKFVPAADVVVSHRWDESTRSALESGKKVLLLADCSGTRLFRGSFKPVFWSPVWWGEEQAKKATMSILCDPKHPALALFPTEFYSNWQWFDLLQNSRTMILDDLPPACRPIVQVIDNFVHNRKLGNLFETRVGSGRLLVCSLDLQRNLQQRPAACQLLRSLLAYMSSADFKPARTLEPDALARLFSPHENRLKELGAKLVRADSEDQDHPARFAVDGDPESFWCTPWRNEATQFPHELVFDLSKPVMLSGCRLLPRQDSRAGWIKDYAIYLGPDGVQWGDPVAKSALSPNPQMKVIEFKHPVAARFVKLVALSSFDNQPWASLAEFDVIPE